MAEAHGSSKLVTKLFGAGPVTKERLAAAVKEANSAQLQILNWWWRGQPAIDFISALIQVERSQIGPTVAGLAGSQSEGIDINIVVHPIGVPVPDGAHLQFTAAINTH
jgi:hypothetical protein